MNLDLIFKEMVEPVLAQGHRCEVDGDGRCAYRGDNGAKCVVGHGIPDKLYNSYFERYPADALLSEHRPAFRELQKYFYEHYDVVDVALFADLLGDLQGIHDAVPVEEWPSRFADLRTKYQSLEPL